MSRSLRDKFSIARDLTLKDWWMLAEAWSLLFRYRLAVQWIPFERLVVSTQSMRACVRQPEGIQEQAQHLYRLVYLASRSHILRMTCLPRTLTLCRMLNRRGIPAQVRIGAAKGSLGVHAHAWVEVDGHILGEPEAVLERFAVLRDHDDPLP